MIKLLTIGISDHKLLIIEDKRYHLLHFRITNDAKEVEIPKTRLVYLQHSPVSTQQMLSQLLVPSSPSLDYRSVTILPSLCARSMEDA